MLVLKHICKFETDYTYHFAEFPKFGAYFLNKIHVGTQKYIHSCAIHSPNSLNLSVIDFSNFLSGIDSREINFIRLPKYIKDLNANNKGKKRERTYENDNTDHPNKKKGKM